MLLCNQKYGIHIIYVKVKHMGIADMLSRSCLADEKIFPNEFENINMVCSFPVRDKKLTQISKATDQDEVCNQVRNII